MKIQNIGSSTVIIETNKLKILKDPWFVNGEYYGSWFHSSDIDINFDIDLLNSATHIYVSHIHPDHFSRKSFEKLNKNIPVLIHDYESKFLKLNIERLGFKVIELEHNKEFSLDSETKIKILAADNCNPELCSKFMGCSNVEVKYKTTQIDSMCLIYNEEYSVLNLNDCPYDLAINTLDVILKDHKKIDLLLVGYAGAGPYPQCFEMDEKEKTKAAKTKELQFLNFGIKFIEKVKPKYYMPFAGTYLLGGKLSQINKYRGVPTLHEALEFFEKNIKVSSTGFLLNPYKYFDLKNGKSSSNYIPDSKKEVEKYLERISKHKFDYENDILPDDNSIINLISDSFKRFCFKKNEINFNSNTQLIIQISDSKSVLIDLTSNPSYKIVSNLNIDTIKRFVKISLDKRLLLRILKGPRFAHWNNAEIGSHLKFERKPNIFERGLYHSLCFFHS